MAVSGPGEPGDLVEARPTHLQSARRPADYRLHVHHQLELPGLAVRSKLGVARGFVLGLGRAFGHLDAAQPLDVNVADPPRYDEAQRVAVLWPHALAILVQRDDGVAH